MQTPGTYISGIGHLGLIGWLIVGWGFDSEPLEFETMDVSVISGEAFNELVAAGTPDAVDAEPVAMPQPVPEEPAPAQPDEEPVIAPTPLPDPVPSPVEETPPPPAPEPPQIAEVEDTAPAVPTPPVSAPSLPDEPISDDPTPQEAERIAAVPTPLAPPDADVDDNPTEQIETDSSEPADVVVEETEPTVAPETTTEIVTEAEEPSSAPDTSMRPVTRPLQTAAADPDLEPETEPEPEQATEEQPEPDVDEDAVAAALAAAVAEETAAAAAAPTRGQLGQGLTSSEVGSVVAAIGQKWGVDVGAQSSNITVVVAFSLNPDGRLAGDVQLVSATDGPASAQQAAFDTARRALWNVSRSGGFPFPADKYDQWQSVEATFDPSGVRLR